MTLRQRLIGLVPYEGRWWLLLVAVLLLIGWSKGINLLMLVACLMLAVWLVNVLASVTQIRRLQAVRRPTGPLFAGARAQWDLALTSKSRRSSFGWRIVDRGESHQQRWFLDRIDGHRTVKLCVQAGMLRRGRYRLEPVHAECLYPFGLARWQRTLTAAEDRIVLPALGRLDVDRFRRWLARMSRGDSRIHRVARPSMIRQDDLHGLRPFRPGDSPRWIHWRTSARRNEKMVREFEESSGQNLIVVLEPWLPSSTDDFHVQMLEDAISLTATICWAWGGQHNDQIMLVVAGDSPTVIGGAATRDRCLRMLEALAVTSGSSRVDADAILKAANGKLIPDAPVVLVGMRGESQLRERIVRGWNRPVIVLDAEMANRFYSAPAAPENDRYQHSLQ